MSKQSKVTRPVPRLPKGLRDIEAAELRAQSAMIEKIRAVYERYGFEPLETPAFEYTDALGKFLPDQDRPNEGVFSLQDDDQQWLSLRYDLTAPLARYVAQHYQFLPKPFRRYAVGPVWRNEKPGPGRFRQFLQFDADTVGAESVAADAELCMLAADTLEALGLRDGAVVKINSRKVLDGVLESIGIDPTAGGDAKKRLVALRAVDKLDRLGPEGVGQLLGKGRKDESGDFTEGAGLAPEAIDRVLKFVTSGSGEDSLRAVGDVVKDSAIGREGVAELIEIERLVAAAGYERSRICFDPSIVRGLEYYTGPVFEVDLTLSITNESGEPVRFGSVCSGGRYDGLVARFTGQKVPATGFSVGVSRLQAALNALHKDKAPVADGPVIVTVMEKDRIADYQKMVQTLRGAGIRAELYLGNPKKFGKQLEYADRRNAPCVVIQGSDENAKGEVMLKDLVEGAKAAAAIKDNKDWKEQRPAQVAVKESDLVAEVRKILARHAG